MNRHELKLWSEHFKPMQSGAKRSDVRRVDDRFFIRGDEVIYREFLPKTEEYSGCALLARITHLTRWAGELELVGLGGVVRQTLRIRSVLNPLVPLVVLSLDVLEVGTYDEIKRTLPVYVETAIQTPGQEGQS